MSVSVADRQSVDVRPPIDVVDGTDGADGVFVQQIGVAAERFTIPSAWLGKYVDFQADGGNFWLLFGGASVAAAPTTESTIVAEVITFKAGSCIKIPSGEIRAYRVPPSGVTKMSLISDAAANAFIRAALSTGSL